MNCYICTQPATGQCQTCWKFYCADHGDRICQPCQERRHTTSTAEGADPPGDVPICQDRSPRSSRFGYPDIKGQPLQRVIGVGQTARHGETEVTLVDLEFLEFYEDGLFAEDGFVANFTLKSWGSGSNLYAALPVPGIIRLPTFYPKAADDQGNAYESWRASRGGGRGQWRQSQYFAPALASSAHLLHVSIDEIQWMAHGPGLRSVIEPGPWEFDVLLE